MDQSRTERVKRGECGKVKRDIHLLLTTDVCEIERNTCPILFETKKQWWDTACRECDKTRAEHVPEISHWTLRILQLKFELDQCKIPYGVDDLSQDEWYYLGVVRQEIDAIQETRRQEAEKVKLGFGCPPFPSR